jgi:hypothetical protein
VDAFDAFQQKQKEPPKVVAASPAKPAAPSKSSKPLPPTDYEFWWEMPARYQRRTPVFEAEEMELVEVCSLVCEGLCRFCLSLEEHPVAWRQQ